MPPSRQSITTRPDVSMAMDSIGTIDRCSAFSAPAKPQNAPDSTKASSRVRVVS